MDPYAELFSDNGHLTTFVPLLKHGPVSIAQTASYLCSREFLEAKVFIITSQRAVEVFHKCLEQISQRDAQTAAAIRSKIGYTVGPATERILRENGFSDVRGGSQAGNGSKLADIILDDMTDLDDLVVFFTGEIRKDIIPVKLKTRGVNLKEQVIYKTEPRAGILENFTTCCEEGVDWIVFFSPQGTEDIVAYLKNVPSFATTKIASIGPTTEQYLHEKGIPTNVVAEKPTASALLEGILQLRDETHH